MLSSWSKIYGFGTESRAAWVQLNMWREILFTCREDVVVRSYGAGFSKTIG